MILGLLATALADGPLEERLLGPPSAPVAAVAAPAGGSGGLLGLLGLVALGVGAFAWRRDRGQAVAHDDLRIVARQTAPGGHLLLVDVRGRDGGSHRLLVGSGGGGIQLLADVTIGLELPDGELP
jgi:hypothetical protein